MARLAHAYGSTRGTDPNVAQSAQGQYRTDFTWPEHHGFRCSCLPNFLLSRPLALGHSHRRLLSVESPSKEPENQDVKGPSDAVGCEPQAILGRLQPTAAVPNFTRTDANSRSGKRITATLRAPRRCDGRSLSRSQRWKPFIGVDVAEDRRLIRISIGPPGAVGCEPLRLAARGRSQRFRTAKRPCAPTAAI